MEVDNGYTANGLLVASAELPRGATEAQTDHLIQGVLERVRAMRGVSAAGASGMIPLMSRTAVVGFNVPESVAGGRPTQGRALTYFITPGYAQALGLRMREGRFFADTDMRPGNLPTIINEEFIRQHVSARPVTGLTIPNLLGQDGATAEIIGVVGNVLKDGNDRQPQPELYLIHGSPGQRISGLVNFVIRTSVNQAALAPDVRGVMRQVDREAVIARIERPRPLPHRSMRRDLRPWSWLASPASRCCWPPSDSSYALCCVRSASCRT